MKIICNLAALSALMRSAYGATGPVFSYQPGAELGPENWGKVVFDDGRVNECDGDEQSPVAFTDEGCTVFADYVMEPGDCTKDNMKFYTLNNGVQADYLDGCTKPTMIMPMFPDAVFEAVQFHFHMGSEHTIDNVTFGAEMHVVHAYTGEGDCPLGRCFAVIGTKLNPATYTNDVTFKVLLDSWVANHNEQEMRCNNTANVIRDPEPLPEAMDKSVIDPYVWNRGDNFFHYQGGLTAPPCSEAVHFNIDDKPAAISVEQFTDLSRIIFDIKDEDCNLSSFQYHGSTSRPVQPLNGRIVEKICPTEMEGKLETKSSAYKMRVTGVLLLAFAAFIGQF